MVWELFNISEMQPSSLNFDCCCGNCIISECLIYYLLGDYVLSEYMGTWYRAQIIKILTDTSIPDPTQIQLEIVYIDYGNTAVVTLHGYIGFYWCTFVINLLSVKFVLMFSVYKNGLYFYKITHITYAIISRCHMLMLINVNTHLIMIAI